MSPVRQISFNFDFEKFLNLMIYIASKVDNLDVLKAMKFLYLIDRHHLVREGRPITGDVYYRLDWGPVPSLSYDLLKQMDDDNPSSTRDLPDSTRLRECLNLDKNTRHTTYRSKVDADLEYFSETERDSIEAVIAQYRDIDSVSLMNLTHQHVAHQKTPHRCKIDFRLFFEDDPGASRDAYEILELEPENRDFAAGLTDNGCSF